MQDAFLFTKNEKNKQKSRQNCYRKNTPKVPLHISGFFRTFAR